MDRKLMKIIGAIAGSLCIVILLSSRFFVSNTPDINGSFIASIPQKTGSLLTSFLTLKSSPPALPEPTLTPFPTDIVSVQPIIQLSSSSSVSSAITVISPTSTPTHILPTSHPTATPTNPPVPTKTIPSPTTQIVQSGPCPTTSNQTYTTIRMKPSLHKIKFDPATSPDTNVALRGYFAVNESHDLISRHGDRTGLDPNMPPQISTLFTNHYPKIINTYDINAWDYGAGKPTPGASATPAWKVHIIGLEATPGEPLVGLKAGRTVDGSHVFLVMYADKNMIMLVHADNDNWDDTGPDGYPFYFMEICVDSNLLALYEKDNAGGRSELPGVAMGQVFGYAKTNEVKMTLRDTGSFMDPRYKEDWWEYGK